MCFRDDNSEKLPLWVMNEYGVPQSWTKILVLENVPKCDVNALGFVVYEPIMISSNVEIFLLHNH